MSDALLQFVFFVAKLAVFWGITLAVILPNLIWAERRVSAMIQDRPGPNRVGPFGLLQSGADVIKFLLKEDLVPIYADKFLYNLAPAILLTASLIGYAVIPFGNAVPVTISGVLHVVPMVIADVNVGILLVFAFASLGVYGIVLAGWSSNDKFSLMGAIRSSAQMISYELAMAIAAAGVFLAAGSLRLTQVVEYQHQHLWFGFLPGWNVFPQFIGAMTFLIATFAETNRLPFDLAEAEGELVAGYHTEYSAFKFAMFFMAEYASMVAGSALVVTLYLGGWSLPGLAFEGVTGALLSFAVFWIKTLAIVFFFLWVRWTLPRFRYDQLMDLGWKVMLPLSLVNLLATGILVAIGML